MHHSTLRPSHRNGCAVSLWCAGNPVPCIGTGQSPVTRTSHRPTSARPRGTWKEGVQSPTCFGPSRRWLAFQDLAVGGLTVKDVRADADWWRAARFRLRHFDEVHFRRCERARDELLRGYSKAFKRSCRLFDIACRQHDDLCSAIVIAST